MNRHNICRFNGRYYALIAQLAERIHGKDEVISSILIEGYVLVVQDDVASQRRFACLIEG